ncbi:hypothetical protein [Bacillus sp. NPDC094106]|uniref:hypothetical protein n=1 Tax=Bacillus sp. NPDC094106 TaxID=3363949 RepID=UPI00380CF6C2
MKYLILGGSFVLYLYASSPLLELGVFLFIMTFLVFIAYDIGDLNEKKEEVKEDERLRRLIREQFSAPEFAPKGQQVIIEKVRRDEYQVYTKKGAYSFVAVRGPFELIFELKKERLSDINFFKEMGV